MNNSIKSNSIKTLFRHILGILVQLINITIIARLLGPEGNGIYSLILLIPNFLALLFSMGFNTSIVYFIGKKEDDLNTIFNTSLFFITFLTIIIYSISYMILKSFSINIIKDVNENLLILGLALFPVLIINNTLVSFFHGLEKFKDLNILLLCQPIIYLVLLSILYLFNLFNLTNVLYLIIISYLFTTILALILMRKIHISFNFKNYSKKFLVKLLKYGFKTHIANLVSFVNYKADLYILSLFVSLSNIGIYAIAVQIVERLWVISKSFTTVLLPRFVQIDSSQDRVNLISKSFRIILILTSFLAICLSLLGYQIISIIFGNEYLNAYYVILFILPGIIFGAGTKVLSSSISARGKPELNMYTSIISMIINIVLNFILIPIYDIYGAAISTTISYTCNTIFKIIIIKKLENNFENKLLIIQINDFKYILDNINKILRKKK